MAGMLDKDTDMAAPGGEGGFKSLREKERERKIEKLLKFITGNLLIGTRNQIREPI